MLSGVHTRILALIVALSFGTTLPLIAQDTSPANKRPREVVLRVDGGEYRVTTKQPTVAALLEEESIVLGEHDRITPPVEGQIEDDLVVVITRVTFEKILEKVEIPAPVVTRWDSRMTTKPVVIRQGKPGVATQYRFVWKKDGVVSEQWTQGRKVVTPPVPTVVVRGNQPSRSGLNERKVLAMVATAYDPGPQSCGRFASGYTAIGMRADRGVIAVDPRVIPLGSRVYVDGYGPAIAADTGGAIKGNRIDVCFPTRSEALKWGRRTVRVVILE